MALNHKRIGGNVGAGGGIRLFTYATEDTRAEVEAAAYFNELYLTVKVGDTILVNSSDELLQVTIQAVDTDAHTVTAVTTMSEGGA